MGGSDTSGSNLPNQRILRKTLLSAISEGSTIFLFLFGILIARALGPSGYGEFTYALAYCALFALVIESGLAELLTREVSHDSVQGKRVLRAGLGYQIILAPIIILLLSVSMYVLPQRVTSSFVISVIFIAVMSRALKSSLRGLLRGSGEFQIESISMAGERISLAVLGIIALVGHWDLSLIVMAFAGLKLIDLTLLVVYIHYRIIHLKPAFNICELKWLVVKLLPFFVTMAIWVLYSYTDMMMLGYFRSAGEVGHYGAIYQFFEGMVIIPSVLSAVFLPWMSYEFKNGSRGVEKVIRKGARIMIAASIPVLVISLIAADEMLFLAFGSDFVEAALGLSIMLGAAPFVLLFWFLRNGLIAIHKTKALAVIAGAGVIFNITTNFLVIPDFGLYGACATTLATEFLTFVLAMYVLRQNDIRGPGLGPWLKCLAAGGILLVSMLSTRYLFGWGLLGVITGLPLAHLLLCRIGFWESDERIALKKWHVSW